jgi:tetratricopeptide (TPR) repeat protein
VKPFRGRRAFLELSLIIFLLALSFALYLTLARRGEREKGTAAFRSRSRFEDGLNLYRLEDYERAGFILRGVLDKPHSKKEGSLAALYLGNIAYLGGDFAAALDFYNRAAALDTKSAFALYNSALAFLAKGEPERALLHAQRALRIDEDFTPAAVLAGNIHRVQGGYGKAYAVYEKSKTGVGLVGFNMASVSLLLGDRDRAERLLVEVIDNRRLSEDRRLSDDRGSSDALVGLSQAVIGYTLRDRNRGKAVDYMRSALQTFPGSMHLRYDTALLLMKDGRFGEALSILRSLDEKNAEWESSGEDFRKILGIALFKSGNYREALEHYLSLVDSGAGDEPAAIIGDIYVKLGDLEQAKRYYRESIRVLSVSKRPGKAASSGRQGFFLNLVQIMVEEREYEEAFRVCADLSDSAPEDPLPALCTAKLLFAMGEKEGGSRALEQATARSKDDLAVLLRIAALYMENNLANNALRVYHRVLSKDEDNYSALAGIARIYMSSGHADRARKSLERALMATADIDVYYDLSLNMAHLLNSGEAASLYRDLIREFPYRFEAYHNLALLSLGTREYEGVERLVDQCFAANRGHPDRAQSDLMVLKGAAQRALGRTEDAVQSFLRARQLDGKNPLPALHLREMENEKNLP